MYTETNFKFKQNERSLICFEQSKDTRFFLKKNHREKLEASRQLRINYNPAGAHSSSELINLAQKYSQHNVRLF